ncbi:LacI family DNA-binding transcriptional regulator [Jiangella asiatica]|uniref:LacI family transcriptional regulator n=1 Tax=Jiangella asiatica TaxID=2530372 RepID=A0A4R5DTZ5_9ACTN|nr:LacI family DNA-binding transcriptional regulator [Jiangella asiatica]TDE14383.1 LacI family transcriptional regulator [Jiangella asiatica]
MKDVARSAGVSVSTVSNVLNRPDYVSSANRLKVLDAIARLGYVRNNAARQLRVGRTRTVGLVVLNIANPFFIDVIRGVEETLSRVGHSVILCNSDGRPPREESNVEMLGEQQVQGVLISPVDPGSPWLAKLADRGVPVVLLDSRAAGTEQCSVSVDDVLGGRLAASHLLEQGHERLVYVSGPPLLHQVTERREGVLAAMAEAGVPADRLTVIECTELSFGAGCDAGERLLGLRPRPTAVICANDLLALGVLQVMFANGVSVPGDVALVGYDDIDFAAGSAVPLTSVRQPRYELGEVAAKLLLDEVDGAGEHAHRQIVMTPELVVRASSSSAHATWSRSRSSSKRR